jgi:hypothetical protein
VGQEHDERGAVLTHHVPISLAASGQVASAAEVTVIMHRALRAALGRERDHGLPQHLARQLISLHPVTARSKFGVGLHRLNSTTLEVWDHGGHRPGLRASINMIPSACLTVVAVTNSDRGQEIIEPVLSMIRAICGCTMAGKPREPQQ